MFMWLLFNTGLNTRGILAERGIINYEDTTLNFLDRFIHWFGCGVEVVYRGTLNRIFRNGIGWSETIFSVRLLLFSAKAFIGLSGWFTIDLSWSPRSLIMM
jgi:hypothetical protein